jgi:hypothetical protein
LGGKLSIAVFPWLIELRITARLAIDLSPGREILPFARFACLTKKKLI